MRAINLKYLILLIFAGFMIQSCSDDINLQDAEIETRGGGQNGSNGNGGNGGNNQNDDQVDRISSEIAQDWTNLFLEIERYAGGMRPNATARALAYINLAAYETALPGIRNGISNEKYLEGFDIDQRQKDRNIDYNIAINATYARVMNHFIINISDELNDKIFEFEAQKEEEYGANMQERRLNDSKEWGYYVADQVIAYAQTDANGESQIQSPQPTSYNPPTGEGYWTFSAEPERALFPYWGSVRTFVISPDQTSTIAPLEYSTDVSNPYYQEMMEVYTVNNTAREEDNEDLWIAEYWSDDVEGITFSPPSRQFSIANQLVDQYRLNLAETLTLYVKLGFSLNDAAVATWKYKYEYMVMRPSVYIQDYIDDAYQTNLYRLIPWPNPTFPGYPSGHSCFASAASGIFIDYFGNQTNFTDRSHDGRTEFRGQARNFKSFEDLAEENAFSRIPLGVHIRMDCVEGLRLGYEISDAINDYDLDKK